MVMRVVAHFIDASYRVQHCLLVPRMLEEHSGDKIADVVAAAIEVPKICS